MLLSLKNNDFVNGGHISLLLQNKTKSDFGFFFWNNAANNIICRDAALYLWAIRGSESHQ